MTHTQALQHQRLSSLDSGNDVLENNTHAIVHSCTFVLGEGGRGKACGPSLLLLLSSLLLSSSLWLLLLLELLALLLAFLVDVVVIVVIVVVGVVVGCL